MTFRSDDIMDNILDHLRHLDYIKASDIPGIDLYMDQVTTFMDSHLGSAKRRNEDKVLTKTMINNYAKNRLLPPPVKKKYSREHLLVLIFIYYFKGFLSFQDIQAILNPLTERFFESDSGIDLEQIYEEVSRLGRSELDVITKDVERICRTAADAFTDASETDREFLELFSLICLLSFDVYVKKQLIEHLIDGFTPEETRAKKGKK